MRKFAFYRTRLALRSNSMDWITILSKGLGRTLTLHRSLVSLTVFSTPQLSLAGLRNKWMNFLTKKWSLFSKLTEILIRDRSLCRFNPNRWPCSFYGENWHYCDKCDLRLREIGIISIPRRRISVWMHASKVYFTSGGWYIYFCLISLSLIVCQLYVYISLMK